MSQKHDIYCFRFEYRLFTTFVVNGWQHQYDHVF